METVTPENDTLTSPSENVDYTFYFEINKKNFRCTFRGFLKSFKRHGEKNLARLPF